MNIEAKPGEVRGMDNEAMLDTAFLYGANAAYLGWGCMAVFGFFFALVWGIMSLISWWANKDENKLD